MNVPKTVEFTNMGMVVPTHLVTLELKQLYPQQENDGKSEFIIPPSNAREVYDKFFSNTVPKVLVDKFLSFYEIDNYQLLETKKDNVLYNDVLKDYQRESVNFILKNKRCILSLDCGLGKTLVSIATISMLPIEKRVLIICPASLKSNWISEFQKFSPTTKIGIIKNAKICEQIINDKTNKVVITSYSLISKIIDGLKNGLKNGNKNGLKKKFDVMIADEAHYIKHISSNRSKAFLKIRKHIEYVILLTGTPSQSHEHLYNLLRQCDPDLYRHFHHHQTNNLKENTTHFFFADRYCIVEKQHIGGGRFRCVYTKNQRHRELHFLISQNILIRRTKSCLNLPPLIREKIIIGETSNVVAKKFQKSFDDIEKVRATVGAMKADAMLLELTRDTSKLKKKAVLEYVLDMVDGVDVKFIVFYVHHTIGDALHDALEAKNIKHIQIDGRVANKKRDALLDSFKNDPSVKIGLLSLGACSTGLNLQFVSLILYAELSFDSIVISQSESRSHRLGQTDETVVLQYLIYNGTTDTFLLLSNKRKAVTSSRTLDNVTDTGKVFSFDCKRKLL